MTVGKRVQRWRVSRGLSQAALAREIGKTRQAVSQIESDTNDPSVQTIKDIQRALGVTEQEFYAYAPPMARGAA